MKCCGKAGPPGAKPWQSHKSEDMYGHREAACSGYTQAVRDQYGTVLLTRRATNTFFGMQPVFSLCQIKSCIDFVADNS